MKWYYKSSGHQSRIFPIFEDCDNISINYNTNKHKPIQKEHLEFFKHELDNKELCKSLANQISQLNKQKLYEIAENQVNNEFFYGNENIFFEN